jgi:hypothetical protein
MRPVATVGDNRKGRDEAGAWTRSGNAGRGATIVVAGHSRGVGKTTTIEAILRGHVRPRWAAVKISAHRHCAPHETRPLVERDLVANSSTQTGRYLSAGAELAFLCRTPASQLDAAAEFVRGFRAEGLNVVIESNRILDFIEPDVVLFAVAPAIADWKASSGVALRRTHAFVIYEPDEAEARRAVRALATKGRVGFALGHGDETARLLGWLARRLPPAAFTTQPHAGVH